MKNTNENFFQYKEEDGAIVIICSKKKKEGFLSLPEELTGADPTTLEIRGGKIVKKEKDETENTEEQEAAKIVEQQDKARQELVHHEDEYFEVSGKTAWEVQWAEDRNASSEIGKLVPNYLGIIVLVKDTNELQRKLYRALNELPFMAVT